jgi:hypothetical protein
MTGFWGTSAVRAALVTGLFSIVATVPPTIVALDDPKTAPPPVTRPSALSCVRLDEQVLKYLDGHPRIRAIYAETGDAASSRRHLGPLATGAEQRVCGNPERLVEVEHPSNAVPQPVPHHGP